MVTASPLPLETFGELSPISRLGGQGRVHAPARVPDGLRAGPLVVKLYRRQPPADSAGTLAEMVSWSRSLVPVERAWLRRLAAWPVAVVASGRTPVGIAMQDVRERFSMPFVMPSGRRDRVLLALEHLLGDDGYLLQRGTGVRLDTALRARVAERVSEALAFLHRHAIVVGDIAPSNLLVSMGPGGVDACFIDCDSMVFRGQRALEAVETADWETPFAESGGTRATDAYKLGLIVLRLFARSHDARALDPHTEHVPRELRDLLGRALCGEPANRPPAGEWQRALRGLAADGTLSARCPGPARSVAPRAPAGAGRAVVGRRAVAPGPMVASRPAPAAAGGPASPLWLRPAVVALWIVAGTVVLALVLSRMFADAIPTYPARGPTPAGYNAAAGYHATGGYNAAFSP